MPLIPGKKNIGKNIGTEEKAGKPPAQAAAIAYREAGEKRKTKAEVGPVGGAIIRSTPRFGPVRRLL